MITTCRILFRLQVFTFRETPGKQISTIDDDNPKCFTTLMTKQKGSILTKPDYDEIRRVVREEVTELTANLPTKDEFTKQMTQLLKAIKEKENKGLVHDDLHTNLGKDTAKLKQQVQPLFKTFEIKGPTEVAISI